MPPRSRLIPAVFGALVALGAVAAWTVHARGGATTDVWGVRLGDSLSMTRDHFRAPAGGAWTSSAAPEPILAWAPGSASPSPVASARFEFHEGMLVAARLELRSDAEAAQGPSLEIGRSSVLARETLADRTRLTLISRDCPEHAAEVRRLLAHP